MRTEIVKTQVSSPARGAIGIAMRPVAALILAALASLGSAGRAEAAIAFVKNVGTNGTKANGSTLAVTVPAAGVAAGNTLIVSFVIVGSPGTELEFAL